MGGGLGTRRHLHDARGRVGRQAVRDGDVPVPLGRSPHRARRELLDRGRARPVLEDARAVGPAPDGVRRLRPAGRERGHPPGDRPSGVDLLEHRADAGLARAAGVLVRLEPAGRHVRARLLPMEPVVLRQALRARTGLPQEVVRELVSGGQDRAGQGAAVHRRVLAVRVGPRAARAPAVVPEDHRLLRPAAGRHGPAPVARVGAGAPARVDRPPAWRGDPVRRPGRERSHGRGRRLHDAARHGVGRDVPGHGARARARPAAGRRNARRAGARGRAVARPLEG